MRRAALCLTFLLLVPERATAEARAVSLRGAVSLAVRRNLTLAQTATTVLSAKAAVLAARGLDDPVLEIKTAIERIRRQRIPGFPVQERAVDGTRSRASLSLPLATGGSIRLRLATGYRRTEVETEAASAQPERYRSGLYAPSLQVSVDQPLLRGFGENVARAQLRQARLQLSVGQAERQGFAASLVRSVVVAYWGLAHAKRKLEVRRALVTAARKQLARTRAGIAVGKLSPSASAEIQVALALRLDALLLAEQAQREQGLLLGQLCGAQPGYGLIASDDLPAIDAGTPNPRQLQATLVRAIEQSPQLAVLQAQVQARVVELEVTNNGLLPQLDLSVSGGPVASAPTMSDAYEKLIGWESYSFGASLSLSLPIGASAARGARNAALANLRKAQLGEDESRAQIRLAVARSIDRLKTARRRARLLSASLRQAELDLKAERARFEVGRASNFDVLRRQEAAATVQLRLHSAELSALQANASLDAATGKIFARHGVIIDRLTSPKAYR